MAVILGNPFGEIRGKLGGSIFSRNGSMAYIKQYAVPVNPNTIAQQSAREGLTIASKSYSSLGASVRAYWNEYAQNKYVPRLGSHSNKYSGYQAYVALTCAAYGGYNKSREDSFQAEGVCTEYDVAYSNFSYTISDPPKGSKMSNLVAKDGTVYDMQLVNISMNQAGDVSFQISFVGCPECTEFTESLDSNGNTTGFVVYCSNQVFNEGMFFKSQLRYCLGYWRPFRWENFPGAELTFNGITLTSWSGFNPSDYITFPVDNDVVRLTLFTIDGTGQLARVGSKDVRVGATF